MLVIIDIMLYVGNFCFVFNCELFLSREQFFLCGSSVSLRLWSCPYRRLDACYCQVTIVVLCEFLSL